MARRVVLEPSAVVWRPCALGRVEAKDFAVGGACEIRTDKHSVTERVKGRLSVPEWASCFRKMAA